MLDRRKFISITAAGALMAAVPGVKAQISNSNNPLIPEHLSPGDTVGLIAPGTAVSDPDEIAKALEAADYFGLKLKIGKYLESGNGYKSRTAEERLEDLHTMFGDSSVKAVISIRGGYGSIQLLDGINYELIKNNPKIFIGYSDITAMLNAINQKTGLVCFHGPMMLSSFTPYTTDYFKKVLFSSSIPGKMLNPKGKSGIREANPTRSIVPGKASGELVGGNLSLLCALMGTPYEIDTKNKIFFFEDVGEEPYRMDRMMWQMKLAGKFDDAAGVVVGTCSGCDFNGLKSSRAWDYTLGESLDQMFSDYSKPVFYGMMAGHTSDQLTLPIGGQVMINSDEGSITIESQCVK